MATYINLDNLARYDMKAKARAEGLYADASAACWQKTEKAGAVTCVPAPETPLEPVVEFLFKETLPEGTKGPGNPSVIAGVSSVTVKRYGKNLAVKRSSKTHNGVTFTANGDGSYTVNGTATGGTAQLDLITKANKVPARTGVPVIISGCPAGGNYQTYSTYVSAHDSNGTWKQSKYDEGNPSGTEPLVPNQDGVFVYSILIKSGTTVSNAVFKPQLEYGDTITDFEESSGIAGTADFGDTFYGGTLDVASGRLTVTHRMVEPSSGTVDISDRPALLPLKYTDTYGRTITSADGTSLSVGSSGGQIVYRLASPYTVQIDPTPIDSLPALGKTSPRVNTIYTDAENVQVGYAEHPAYTEELINNAILALGGDI